MTARLVDSLAKWVAHATLRTAHHTTHKYVGRSTREHPKRGCSIDPD